MHILVDANLSPDLCPWISSTFSVETESIINMGLQGLTDRELFARHRVPGSIVMTKDSDFCELVDRFGPPPNVIHVQCGNTSNTAMRRLLQSTLRKALDLIAAGEPIVEIGTEQ